MDVPDSTGGDVRAERLEVINQCMRVQPVPVIVASAPGDQATSTQSESLTNVVGFHGRTGPPPYGMSKRFEAGVQA